MEMLAAGTLAILADKGHRISVVTMTPGDCGSGEYGPEELSAIRRREAAEAASMIGAEYRCAEFRDMAIFADDPSRRRMAELIRSLRPDVVLTSAPADYHCDHEATSALVRDACFAVSAPNYRTGTAEPLDRIPHLYFMDSVEGRDRDGRPVHPEFGVNIEAKFELKRRMLSVHASQRNWLLRQHGMDDYLRTMEDWTRERGQSFAVKYAEGFRQYRHHPYPTTPLLQELVGDALLH
jgi:LmbE family N-acetylglucosaminyl deacetylase